MNQVLEDVRRALGRGSSLRPVPLEPFIEPRVETDTEGLVERFSTELALLGGHVHQAGSDELQFVDHDPEKPAQRVDDKLKFVGQIADRIAAVCQTFSVIEVALSGSVLIAEMGLAEQLTARGLTIFVPDISLEHSQLVTRLAGCSVGVTAADYAIAETGTIVLSSDERNALLVSLLPPIHIALLGSSQIDARLDQVIAKLAVERVGRADPSRSVSFITGPSRTSDVELTLSIGVHGPKELHVIIVDQ